jgi:hypothetical protein
MVVDKTGWFATISRRDEMIVDETGWLSTKSRRDEMMKFSIKNL